MSNSTNKLKKSRTTEKLVQSTISKANSTMEVSQPELSAESQETLGIPLANNEVNSHL
jgi:hypothetical protein